MANCISWYSLTARRSTAEISSLSVKGSPECVLWSVTLRYLNFIAEITFFLKSYVCNGFLNTACCQETNPLQQDSIVPIKKEKIFRLVIVKTDNQQQYDEKKQIIKLTPLLECPNTIWAFLNWTAWRMMIIWSSSLAKLPTEGKMVGAAMFAWGIAAMMKMEGNKKLWDRKRG